MEEAKEGGEEQMTRRDPFTNMPRRFPQRLTLVWPEDGQVSVGEYVLMPRHDGCPVLYWLHLVCLALVFAVGVSIEILLAAEMWGMWHS